MITDARVLKPEFIPQEVKHRDSEVNHLSSALDPLTNRNQPDPILLYGSSGVGKTCIAQYLVEQLRETVVDINTQYVNCWEDHNRFKTLYRLVDGIEETATIHRRSTPTDQLLERLRNYDGPPYVVILDEVDQLDDKSLLYDLYRIRNISMILIANSAQDLFTELSERLYSRFTNCVRIHFEPYHEDELVNILQDRVQWGLEPGLVDTSELELIAANAAGDARVAIGILRRAARDSHADRITAEVIQKVAPEAKSEIEQKTIDRLKSHQKILHEIITGHEEIKPQPLYAEYCERADDPNSHRMVRKYLAKMEHYNLIVAEGNTKARRYRSIP